MKKFVRRIVIIIAFLTCIIISGVTVYAGYNSEKHAYTYQTDLFDADYAGGYIKIDDSATTKYVGMERLDFDFLGDDSTWIEGYGGSNGKSSGVYADHYNGAVINGEPCDVREYVWIEEGNGQYYLSQKEWINGVERVTGGLYVRNSTGTTVCREFHFYKRGVLEDASIVDKSKHEVPFYGVLQLTDFDDGEGYHISSDNLKRAFVNSDTTVKYDENKNNTWLGTEDDAPGGYERSTLWVEVRSDKNNPLTLSYIIPDSRASDVNYYNDRIPVNYYIVDNAGNDNIKTYSSTTAPRYSNYKPIVDAYKGYTFSGWYYDAGLTQPVPNTIEIRTQGSLNFYGKFTPIYSYTIQYDPNSGFGGTGNMSYATRKVYYDQSFTIESNGFSNSYGYEFSHWAVVRESDQTVFCNDNTWKPLASTPAEQWCPYGEGWSYPLNEWWVNPDSISRDTFTFYAQWVDTPSTTPKHKLTINPNGGKWNGSTDTKSFTLKEGATMPVPDPTREGYDFTGWTPTGKVTNKMFTMGTADVTLTANWSKKSYNVTLIEGTGISAVTGGGSKAYGSSVTINATVETGYHWKNWTGTYTTTTQKYTFTMPAKDVSMTANAEANTYKIKFNGNGATSGSMSDMSCVYDKTYTLTANAYENTGYTFNGWNTKADGSGTSYANKASVKNLTTTNGGTVTLYAQWKANTYKIKFDGNGATSGSMSDMSCEYGKTYTLTANAYENTGHTFTGWNTKANGSGTSYANKASVKNLTTTNGGTVTLYAQWRINTSTLKIDPSGGVWNGSENVQTYKQNYNTVLTIQPPARVGYTFVGWEKSDPFYGTLTSDSPESIATYTFGASENATSTITAKWKINYYTLNLIAGYGIESVSSTGDNQNAEGKYAYGSSVTITAKEKSGFHFVNWTGTLGTIDEQTYTFTMPANDVEMTANGEANSYTISFHPNEGGEVTPIANIAVKYDETVILPNGTPNFVKYTLDGVNITSDVLSGAISLNPILLEAENEDALYNMILQAENEGYKILDDVQVDYIEEVEEHIEGNMEVEEHEPVIVTERLLGASVRAVLDAYPSVFKGWSLETEKSLYVPTWQADEEMLVKMIVDAAGTTLQDGAVITLYVIWDDCPWIAAEDLYFTLQEAQSGLITYDELMSHASASDREDGSQILPGEVPAKGTSFKLIDYLAEDYTELTADGIVTETYQVIDSSGSVYEKMITVYIVDSTPQLIKPIGTTRFINEKYYYESYENGGLEDNSIWKTDPEYIAVIEEAFENSRNNTPIIEFHFTREEILEMKEFVRENGVGNSLHEDALSRFYEEFMAPNVVE